MTQMQVNIPYMDQLGVEHRPFFEDLLNSLTYQNGDFLCHARLPEGIHSMAMQQEPKLEVSTIYKAFIKESPPKIYGLIWY